MNKSRNSLSTAAYVRNRDKYLEEVRKHNTVMPMERRLKADSSKGDMSQEQQGD